ncbi:S8 family serine peptidase [bacterium]|nr:S8 family serine peptidase [bacterium]
MIALHLPLHPRARRAARFVLAATALFALAATPAYADIAIVRGHEADANTVLVAFDGDAGGADIALGIAGAGFRIRHVSTVAGRRLAPEVLTQKSFALANVHHALVEIDGDIEAAIARLSALAPIRAAEPNFLHRPLLTPNDEHYVEYQGNFRQINVERAWDYGRGEGVVVSVIDTGYRTEGMFDGATHLLAGYDFWGDDEDATDYSGHGTHVANTVAEATNNGVGMAGIAFEATILPVKVFPDSAPSDAFYAKDSDVIDGILYSSDEGAHVINMSLGGGGASGLFQSAITQVFEDGVVVIAASGNTGRAPVEYPAAYDNVLSVGASRRHDPGASPGRAFFSSFGDDLDVIAPGSYIFQQTFDEDSLQIAYYGLSGTSMASPHAAGVAALMISVAGHDPELVVETMIDTAFSPGGGFSPYLGFGEIDAYAAVRAYMDAYIDESAPPEDDDDDDTDDDADDDAQNEECEQLAGMIYDQCAYALDGADDILAAETACEEGDGDWECVAECADHPNVTDCASFATCLDDRCGVKIAPADADTGGGDDDDDDGGSCGC